MVRAADAIQRFVETYDSSWRAAAAVAQKYRATLAGTSRTEEYLRIIEEQLSLVGLPPAV